MTDQIIIFFQIVFIDLVLAGDNAIIIGMVASQFPIDQRKKIIFWGISAAVILRIVFTLITAYLLQIKGIRLVGGILLLYICYKLYVDVVKDGPKKEEDPNIEVITVGREAETMAIAAGVIVGGKIPVCLVQNTGMMESGDSIRGLGLDCNLPIVMIIGYRGWTRWGITPDSAARLTEPTLNAWGIQYYLVEHDGDADRITLAFQTAAATLSLIHI